MDGCKTTRVVCFVPKLRSSFEKWRENGEPVAVLNCKVQEGKYGQTSKC